MRTKTRDGVHTKCIYCRSDKVIRHGRTSTGKPRYRCRQCGRTWVQEKIEVTRPDLISLVEAYLSGRTFRDLVEVYRSSPLRINKKVREFLEGCPNWEEYLDLCVPNHYVKSVFLIGRTFAATTKQKTEHKMFIAMAVDGFSTVVLGFEVSEFDDYQTWFNLLERMRKRGINIPVFITNGSIHIEEAVANVYPTSVVRLFYHRNYRDRELNCCLTRLLINPKLLNDAIYAFENCYNQALSKYLKIHNNKYFQDILRTSSELFYRRLRQRLSNKERIRVEGIYNAFQSRFEKFHMLKSDPLPLVNGWIAHWLTFNLDIGFSRLSIYMQVPVMSNFKLFSCGQVPTYLSFFQDSPILNTFVVELAVRALQMPIFYNRCEMKLDKCSLI